MAKVLSDYGYHVRPDGGDREQQFSCDLHGDGHDNKPSARVYPESSSAYCFACGRSRDAIQWAMEKEGLEFWDALKVLEERYRLPPLPWEDGDDDARAPLISSQIEVALDPTTTFAADSDRLSRLLDILTEERECSMAEILSAWEAFDAVCWGMTEGGWNERRGKVAIEKIRKHLIRSSLSAAEGKSCLSSR